MIFFTLKFTKYYSVLFLILLLLHPAALKSEFYEYIDENGVKSYTDDQSLIPENQREDIKTHKEKYDHLSEEQKAVQVEKEQKEIKKLQEKTQADLDRFEQQKEADRKKQQKIERQKRLDALKTPIIISRNKILLPVSIKYSNKEITVPLLLDTGSTVTSVNQFVAEQLNINTGESSAVMVAGGGIIRTKRVKVQHIKIGPKILKAHKIMILNHNGNATNHQGLLGQDFLQRFRYTIDYANSVILWEE
jgi:hypothetical protein